ncbi:RNase adapter RapZ [Acidipropionibacterium jensenii]|uniref:RNase adapter RapZ n=1 Tax=Acidipropionibacterium jensenii TaxID=1749 RepID=UPI00214CEC8D
MTSPVDTPASPATQRVVVITGMSGAGRRTTAHAMEDLGWYVVDNLPPAMLSELVSETSVNGVDRLAVVLDVRTRGMFENLDAALRQLHSRGVEPQMVYLEASDEAIVKRQESSRRPLPLQHGGHLLDAIARERRMLSGVRAAADLVIDTTSITTRQLAQRIDSAFAEVNDQLTIQLMTFGFKRGVPIDADLVFDVRFLPNPYWVPELRPKTGLSPDVSSYVLAQSGAREFIDRVDELLAGMEPGYLREGKKQVTVAIGCTGGKHRSTAIAEELARRLRSRGRPVAVLHRDLGRE